MREPLERPLRHLSNSQATTLARQLRKRTRRGMPEGSFAGSLPPYRGAQSQWRQMPDVSDLGRTAVDEPREVRAFAQVAQTSIRS